MLPVVSAETITSTMASVSDWDEEAMEEVMAVLNTQNKALWNFAKSVAGGMEIMEYDPEQAYMAGTMLTYLALHRQDQANAMEDV